MYISTETGDLGETSLFTGERVKKNDPRIICLGDLDELNAQLGLVRAKLTDESAKNFIYSQQQILFEIMSWIASCGESGFLSRQECISAIEAAMDKLHVLFDMPKSFVTPGGSELSAIIDIARTVARRAERALCGLFDGADIDRTALIYMNRLSDYLFVLARYADA